MLQIAQGCVAYAQMAWNCCAETTQTAREVS